MVDWDDHHVGIAVLFLACIGYVIGVTLVIAALLLVIKALIS